MRWINLAERMPSPEQYTHNTVCRHIHTKKVVPEKLIVVDREGTKVAYRNTAGAAIYEPLAFYEWLDESVEEPPSLGEIQDLLTEKMKGMENPVQHLAPGVWKIGNAYTGDAGAELADKWIREAFTKVPENIQFPSEKPQITTYQETQYREYKSGHQSFRQYLENVYPGETRVLLAEQHRNTRHDAIEALNTEYCSLYPSRDGLSSRLTQAIINIKQRKPI